MKKMKYGFFAMLLAVLFAGGSCEDVADALLGPFPVTDITGVPTTAVVGVPLALSGTVEPSNASKKAITWTIKNGQATLNNSQLTASRAGDITVTAAIIDGLAGGPAGPGGSYNFTKDFVIRAQNQQTEAAFTGLAADSAAPTAKLILRFDQDIAGLSAADITLIANGTGAAKGNLTRTGTGIYELGVSGITADGTVTLSVAKANFNFSPSSREVTVKGPAGSVTVTDAAFSGLSADSAEPTGTLTLRFDKDIAGLSAADISLDANGTGAAKGNLTRTGTGSYELVVSGITADGTVTVSVTKTGFNFNPASRTAEVKGPAGSVTIPEVAFTALTADSAEPTGKLTLKFDKDIAGFAAADINLIANGTGAAKGTLARTGTGTYELGLSGITADGTVAVEVAKAGFDFNPYSREAAVKGPAGTAAITITLAQITENAPAITGPTLYRFSNGGPTTADLTVDNPGQYDSISWRVQDTDATGTGPSFTLSAANSAYNTLGGHFVTVFVVKGGMPYNRTVSFRVEY